MKPSETFNKLAVKKRKSYRKGDEVKLIQEALLKLGFDLGTAGVDGIVGQVCFDVSGNPLATMSALAHQLEDM